MLHARLSGPVQHLRALSYDHAEAESAHGIGCSLSDLAWQHRVAALPASSTCLVFVHADQVARAKAMLRSERRITHVHDSIERFDAERHGCLLGDALAAWLRHALQQHGYVDMKGCWWTRTALTPRRASRAPPSAVCRLWSPSASKASP